MTRKVEKSYCARRNGRTPAGVEEIKKSILHHLFCEKAKFPEVATRNDFYMALAYTVRDRLMERWVRSAQTYLEKGSRTVVYLSAEYLIGPQLEKNLICLGILDQTRQAVEELGLCLEDLLDQEEEPGLGNGGLGRLAACYMDSLATVEIPAIGYGIRYEFGIFDQAIKEGWQEEVTDKWLRLGNPWEIAHPEIQIQVKFGGRTEHYRDDSGKYRVRWLPDRIIMGTPFDTPILGYRVSHANVLRLWKAEAFESFDLAAFNVGDYYRAVMEKMTSENITKILYPNDEPEAGKKLRLEQQYFFVSCALQDLIRIHLQRNKSLDFFAEKFAVQLNDTHPALGVAELMRLLVDEHGMEWGPAWEITQKVFSYTNHTLMPEAMEKWPVWLFEKLLPRHLEIIYEINRRFLEEVRIAFPGDDQRLARLSIIEEFPEKRVRMANLACVGSHAVNGVAALHTELLKTTVLSDFNALWPSRFYNRTNGVTPRRFLLLSNPGLSRLITEAIGENWVSDLDRLRELEPFADDAGFREKWLEVKLGCKKVLATFAQRNFEISLAPESVFDVQVKRIHEYKRQHLNALNIIDTWRAIRDGRLDPKVPRCYIFAGKAAPGYGTAKRIIRLIHGIAEAVNSDPKINGAIRVAFLPDFNVKNAQKIYPAADISEQISTAGYEASGTGNMKFAMNGAVTIGTLDGANVEIREAVGQENFFLFGLTAEEVRERHGGGYRPLDIYGASPALRGIFELIISGVFSRGDRTLFQDLLFPLLKDDPFMLLADYESYAASREAIFSAWSDREQWARMSILNTARIGKFSSDRAIREYCADIWKVEPVHVV